MENPYLRKPVQLLKENGAERSYWILGSGGKVLARGADFFNIEPTEDGWRVYFQERGRIYKSYTCRTEREACSKFLKLTNDDYHLLAKCGKYFQT